MLKFVVVLYRRPDLSPGRFHEVLRDEHGPMAEQLPGLRKYVQNHVVPDPNRLPPGWDAVVELFWDDWAAMEAAWKTPEGRRVTQRRFARYLIAAALPLMVPAGAAGDDCADAKLEVKTACCTGSTPIVYDQTGGLFTQTSTPTETITLKLCDGSSQSIRCIRRSRTSRDAVTTKTTKQTTEPAPSTPQGAACNDAFQKAKVACNSTLEGFALENCESGSTFSALPVCEYLEALAGADQCSPWDVKQCFREIIRGRGDRSPGVSALFSQPEGFGTKLDRACLDLWTGQEAEALRDAWRPLFTANPETATVQPIAHTPLPPGTKLPVTPSPPPLAAYERIVSSLRLEVPGNFVRFFMKNAALPVALGAVESLGKEWHCDDQELSCSLNQVRAFDMNAFLQKHRKFDPTPNDWDRPQGLVNAKAEQTEKGWDVSNLEFNVGGFVVNWFGRISVTSNEPLRFKLRGPGTHFQLLPLHDPKGENPPFNPTRLAASDQKSSYIDRTWLVFPTSSAECEKLRDQKLDGSEWTDVKAGEGLGEGVYLTAVEPYKCNCVPPPPPPGLFSYSVSYCIVDPWPRQTMVPDLQSGLPDETRFKQEIARMKGRGWRVWEVFCHDGLHYTEDPLDDLGPAHPKTTQPSIHTAFPAWPPADRQRIVDDILGFGCSGRRVERLKVGTPETVTVGSGEFVRQVTRVEEVTDGIGFKFDGEVDPGEIKVGISPASITLDFPLEWKVHRWVEEHVPVLGFLGVIIGWIIDVILFILSVFLTVLVSIQLYVWGPLITGTLLFQAVNLKPDKIPIEVHGVIAHHPRPVKTNGGFDVQPEDLEIGVRRIVTRRPNVKLDTWDLHFDAPSCQKIIDGEGQDGFEEVLNFFKNSVVCPIQVIGNVVNVVTLPVKKLLLWLVKEVAIDLESIAEQVVTATAADSLSDLEKDSTLATLMVSSLRVVQQYPKYSVSDASVKALLDPSQLPPALRNLCLMAPQPLTGCAIANLFGYNGEAPAIERMGVKTHYRSMQDYGIRSVADILDAYPARMPAGAKDHPPVRYCLGGAVPRTGLRDYRFGDAPALLNRLTTLDEIHYTQNVGDPATDWRTQCAAFIDSHVKFHVFVRVPVLRLWHVLFRTYEVIVAPSARTNLLVNEFFFCPSDESCDPGIDVEPIRECAHTSGCDLEAKLKEQFAGSNFSKAMPPIRLRAELAKCSMLADVWYRIHDSDTVPPPAPPPYRSLLGDGADAHDVAVSLIQQSCPLNANCPAQVAEVNKFFGETAATCSSLLRLGKMFDPARRLKDADIPNDLK
jgi:uncharacterized protein (TIGR02118 family)